jgi:hypothetical protein
LKAELLHVVTVVANPIRWQSRTALYRDFESHMLDSGVQLTVVECAYGDRPFELAGNPHINHVGVRAKTLVWNKENLINLGIARLPHDWKYVGWIDADVEFRKSGWAAEAVHALQQYDVIQPWSDAYDLGPNDEHLQHHKSFCRLYWQNQPVAKSGDKFWVWEGGPYEFAHPGYAWCATRSAMEWLGGLLETGALGAGDHHMALALVGRAHLSMPGAVHPNYAAHVLRWQQRALQHLNHNIGFLWGTIEHSWHGRKEDRKYVDRWEIIRRHNFDPDLDLKRNVYGVMELAGNKPMLRHDIDVYFRQRNEDANTL